MKVYDWFNISFDIFGRTTKSPHEEITHDIFLKLYQNGYMQERMTTQLYCSGHRTILADRYVVGECPDCGYADAHGEQCDVCSRLVVQPVTLKNPRCKLDGCRPTTKKTKHIFVELDKLESEVNEFYEQSSRKGKWPTVSKSITEAWLNEGLQPRSITRDIKWGSKIPLRDYENKVIYPWFDAPIGYISITAQYTDQWKKWWQNPDEVELHQFIGKYNVLFHSILFPATLMGTGDNWTKVYRLNATDFLTYEGGKFSKFCGVGVFGDLAEKTGVPSDVWRFFLLSSRPETGDTEFTWDSFISSNNITLVGNLGRFVNSVLFLFNLPPYNGIVPDSTYYSDIYLETCQREVNKHLALFVQDIEFVKLRDGLAKALHISQLGNNLLKQHEKTASRESAAVISLAVNLVHLVASFIALFLPETASSINTQLCAGPLLIPDRWTADSIQAGHKIGETR
ncbi:methionyl-tRNA synthetase [Xylariaceae sp. FL0255]|nr:methionyl-tRNA synthetase [Xylariaceae sp. FL0255]